MRLSLCPYALTQRFGRHVAPRFAPRTAIHIPKILRGFLARPKTDFVHELKETRSAQRLLKNSKTKLTHDLLEMTERVGLQPIPGLTLNSRRMMEREKQEKELKHLEGEDDNDRNNLHHSNNSDSFVAQHPHIH